VRAATALQHQSLVSTPAPSLVTCLHLRMKKGERRVFYEQCRRTSQEVQSKSGVQVVFRLHSMTRVLQDSELGNECHLGHVIPDNLHCLLRTASTQNITGPIVTAQM
jgi:hypothetical protein